LIEVRAARYRSPGPGSKRKTARPDWIRTGRWMSVGFVALRSGTHPDHHPPRPGGVMAMVDMVPAHVTHGGNLAAGA